MQARLIQTLTVFECINLFRQNLPDPLLAFVYIIIADSIDYQLLQLHKFFYAIRWNSIAHLFVVMSQLTNILEISDILPNLLLVLPRKSLSTQKWLKQGCWLLTAVFEPCALYSLYFIASNPVFSSSTALFSLPVPSCAPQMSTLSHSWHAVCLGIAL